MFVWPLLTGVRRESITCPCCRCCRRVVISFYYDEDLSDKLVKYLFAPRNSIDPNEAFRLFRGRDADVNALLRARGFPTK